MIRVCKFKVRFAVNLANVTLGMSIMTITNMIHQAIAIDKTFVLHKLFLLCLETNFDDIQGRDCNANENG